MSQSTKRVQQTYKFRQRVALDQLFKDCVYHITILNWLAVNPLNWKWIGERSVNFKTLYQNREYNLEAESSGRIFLRLVKRNPSDPLTPRSDQEKISPYNIDTI